MPPTKHREKGESPILDWIVENAKLTRDDARAAFESAKQAKYLVMRDGEWHFDAKSGYFHFHKPKPEAVKTDKPELTPLHMQAWAHLSAKPPESKAAGLEAIRKAFDLQEEDARKLLNDLFKHELITKDASVVEII